MFEPPNRSLFHLRRPDSWRGGVIIASPHSGRDYPEWLLRQSALDAQSLRASEDAFVDRLIAPARHLGAVVLSARVPRSVVDLNRARDELDPLAVEEVGLTPSARSRAGLGVIPRLVARDRPIRRAPIPRAEAEALLATFWQPYHDALDGLMAQAMRRFGQAVLIDVHSMPHSAVAHMQHPPKMVLGDLWGQSCAPWLGQALSESILAEGVCLSHNVPFAGAHILTRHGRPQQGRHAIQLEIDRSLYMDEVRLQPNINFAALSTCLASILRSTISSCEQHLFSLRPSDSRAQPIWRP